MEHTAPPTFDAMSERVDWFVEAPDAILATDALDLADELLVIGEAVLVRWLVAHDREPTDGQVEGFRLLALHRQAAKGDPSFNACRESCRELVYHRNLVHDDPSAEDVVRNLRFGAMVARHLVLFVGGKLDNSGLGEFCCSSRPLRQDETAQGGARHL
ncbi:hypothetical protein [Microbaculum sp. FT89]|uniref:hypothetical protein n=1 Tax=Microbaculum sp. FT89 TaxID=3447298 RepID=UPI003F53AFF0